MATDKGIALTNQRCTVLFDNCTKYPRISNKRCFDSQVSSKCLHRNSSEPVFICGPTDQSEVWRPVISVILVGSTTKSDQHHPTSQDKILGRIFLKSQVIYSNSLVLPPRKTASGSAFIGSAVACSTLKHDRHFPVRIAGCFPSSNIIDVKIGAYQDPTMMIHDGNIVCLAMILLKQRNMIDGYELN